MEYADPILSKLHLLEVQKQSLTKERQKKKKKTKSIQRYTNIATRGPKRSKFGFFFPKSLTLQAMFGGKSMGGGNMLRSVGRAVTRTNVSGGGVLQEPLSSSAATSAPTSTQTHKPTSSNNVTLSSSSSSSSSPFASNNIPNPMSPTSCKSIRPFFSNPDDFDWLSVDGSDDERSFGAVPSLDEVQSAVSALQQ